MKLCTLVVCSLVIAAVLPIAAHAQLFTGITKGDIIKVTTSGRDTIYIDTNSTPGGDYATRVTFSDFKDSMQVVDLTSYDPGLQTRQTAKAFIIGGQILPYIGAGIDSQCYIGLFTGTSNGTLISYTLDPTYNDGPFTMWSNYKLTWSYSAPDSGAVWNQNTTDTIRFTCTNPTIYSPDTVNVLAILPNGHIDTIALDLLGNPNTAVWNIPYMPSVDDVYITVSTTDGIAAKSSASFSIHGATLAIDTVPSILHPGGLDTIQWNCTDSIAPGGFTIQYTTNINSSPVVWKTIATNLTALDSMYIWSIPDSIKKSSATAQIRMVADSNLLIAYSTLFVFGTTVGVTEPESFAFTLGQNYPNPFSSFADNGMTNVPFALQSAQAVGMRVFDALGRQVATTPAQWFGAGQNTLRFDGSQLTSGVYYYELTANGGVASMRRAMLYVR